MARTDRDHRTRIQVQVGLLPEQDALFRQFAGMCRLVYNLGLEQKATWGRKHRLCYVAQAADLTKLRAEFDWVRAVYVSCQQQALRDLDRAFRNFSAGRASFPRPRRRGVDDSFRFPGREVAVKRLNGNWSAVRLPKIGWVKFRDSRPIRGVVKNVTVSLDAVGWHVAFTCEIVHEALAPGSEVVGIDRGVATTLALSTGEMLTMPASLEWIEARKRKAQCVVARRKRGSNRRRRALARVARLQARQARIRRDFHNRAALDIARRYGVAVFEDLNTRGMTTSAEGTIAEPGRNVRQKAGLNRTILAAGWHLFATILTYKMEQRGGQVVTVPARFTSQTCAACGAVDARSRESQARFVCVGCGHTDHADINAAINIRRRWNTSLLDVKGVHRQPVEASTGRDLPISENPHPSGRGRC
ncbi:MULTISPECIES: RNA-guided endonuclease TnpB family protein [unclassified Methylobacterium]|jgi:putative transposase|uniref:RNA-guided endonuclease InsQ/TnpB family protein n=1 Tax=unclassified Methylobacterium TaxID=2615210 RepID=UPI0008F3694D|nr:MULTISPECIES: RNA-guided endonuclease TnpB family protein [unclassified Methylobacterium]SFU97079.1 putative transposase [Methylobacterium sp. UNCCL125]